MTQMSEEARQIIEKGAFTLPEVVAEVVYVLSGVYKIERNEIGSTLIDFFDELGDTIASFDKKLNKMLD